MQIRAFPPHYQLVYINIDIPSFSVISYKVIRTLLQDNSCPFEKRLVTKPL